MPSPSLSGSGQPSSSWKPSLSSASFGHLSAASGMPSLSLSGIGAAVVVLEAVLVLGLGRALVGRVGRRRPGRCPDRGSRRRPGSRPCPRARSGTCRRRPAMPSLVAVVRTGGSSTTFSAACDRTPCRSRAAPRSRRRAVVVSSTGTGCARRRAGPSRSRRGTSRRRRRRASGRFLGDDVLFLPSITVICRRRRARTG